MDTNKKTIKVDEGRQNRIIVRNGIASIGFKGMSYLISFFTAPLLLACLGDMKYGIYTTSLALVSWINYFDFGVGSGLRNRVAESVINEDYETAQKSVSVAYCILTLVSFAVSIIVLVASLILDFDKLLNAGLNDESLNICIVIAIVFVCINFVLSLSKNLLWAVQKTALVDGIGIIAQIFWLVALWTYSYTGRSSLLIIVIFEGLTALIGNIIAQVYIIRKHPRLKPAFKDIDMSYSKGILSFGIQIFIMQICALVLNATDNIIIMKLYSAIEVTPYSMAHKYFSIINTFFVVATGPLWTAYTTAYAMKDTRYIKKTLKRALSFYAIIFLGIVLACFIFVPFMRVYLGRDLEYQSGLIFLVALYYAILIFSHNFSAFVHGISKVKLTTIACAVGAIVNIPCSIFFATTCGLRINGIILGSIISLLITTPCYIYTTIKEIRVLEKCENKTNESRR